MDLIPAMTVALTGRPAVDEHSDLADILADLVAAAGSAARAAREIGVSPTTFYRWRNAATGKTRGIAQTPKTGKRTMIAASRRLSLSADLRQQIVNKQKNMSITGWFTVPSGRRVDRRHRTCHVGREFPLGTMAPILDAWQSGNDTKTQDLLFSAIHRFYVEDLGIEEVTKITF